MANNNGENSKDELEKLRRQLEEVQRENKRLKEIQEKNDLGRQVLRHLQKGGGNDRVIRALDAVQRVYGDFEASFDLTRQNETITKVEELKESLSSAMTRRNVSGGVGVVALGVQVACYAHPATRIASGLVGMGSCTYSLFKQAEVEQIFRRIQNLLQADVERFQNLARAVEALDAAWKAQFEYSLHSEKFRKLCKEISEAQNTGGNAAGLAVAEVEKDPKLREGLSWFARVVNWKNVQTVLTSQYFYSIIQILAAFVNDPIIDCAVPGLYGACQLFLLVRDNFSYREKLSQIDEGLQRMKRQSEGMDELIKE